MESSLLTSASDVLLLRVVIESLCKKSGVSSTEIPWVVVPKFSE